jgi:hypothetical protein
MAGENKRVAVGMVLCKNKPQGGITQCMKMGSDCGIAGLRTVRRCFLLMLYESTLKLL